MKAITLATHHASNRCESNPLTASYPLKAVFPPHLQFNEKVQGNQLQVLFRQTQIAILKFLHPNTYLRMKPDPSRSLKIHLLTKACLTKSLLLSKFQSSLTHRVKSHSLRNREQFLKKCCSNYSTKRTSKNSNGLLLTSNRKSPCYYNQVLSLLIMMRCSKHQKISF